MIGAGVTDMIAEAVLGRKLETTGHEVLKTVHPHPTMSEAVMEAVADAYGEVIHLQNNPRSVRFLDLLEIKKVSEILKPFLLYVI